MCNNFFGGNCAWIIVILLLLFCCGNNGIGAANNGCGCGCGCNDIRQKNKAVIMTALQIIICC